MDSAPASDYRRPTLLTYLLLALLVLVPLFVMISPYLVSLASGAVLAVLCQPLYARLRKRLKPVWAGLVVTLGVLVLVLVPITLLVVGAVRQAAVVVDQVSASETLTGDGLASMVQRTLPFTDAFGSPEEVRVQLREAVTSVAQSVSGVVLAQLGMLPDMILQLVLVALATYFFLVDGRRAFKWIAEKVPLSRQIRLTLVASFRSATTAVVLASIAASGAQALTILVGFVALGVPAAFLAAGLSFVLAWIPTVGTVPVWGSAVGYLYMNGHPGKAAIMVGIGIAVGLIDNVVRPMVLRGREEMHPLVSLIAIVGGIAFLGVPGAFLGPLLASLAISILDIWPAVAAYCGIPVSGAGGEVPEVPLLNSGK
ncbi:MAG: AI-2E family transporter [Myxococcota bacterium]